MDRRLLDILVCPSCGGTLALLEAEYESVPYAAGPREEIKSGSVSCMGGCKRHYPIVDFVLSLAQLFPPDLRKEAAYWERYYLWLLKQGSLGFHDLRLGVAPYITLGVPEPFPAADTIDRYTAHQQVAEHPLMRRGTTLLDMGVGLGWTSLHFARAGYDVTAFEPSLGPVIAAKRHGIEQGVFIEYICAALGTGQIAFRPGSFDNVTAFHSLHHVPDLEEQLRSIKRWLKSAGAFAIDEHIGNSRLAARIGGEIHAWAEAEVFPRYRTLAEEALASLPQEPHSAMEDTSVDQVVPLVTSMFSVQLSISRHVFLDHYPLLYYLYKGRDLPAYVHALEIANQLQDFVSRADPEGPDYVTIVAENAEGAVGDQGSEVSTLGAEMADTQPFVSESTGSVSHDTASDPYSRIAELEAEITAQAEWAHGLEEELLVKNTQVSALRSQLRRVENGRVMRLMRFVRSIISRHR